MQTSSKKIAADLFEALDKSLQSIYYVIQDGHFVYGNYHGCRITGLDSQKDVIGKPGLTFVHPDDRDLLASMTKKVMHGKKIPPFEWRLHTIEGNTVWVMGSLTKINFNNRPAVLGNYIDITHLKQTRFELKTAYKKIEDLTIDLDSVREEERAQIAWEVQENLGSTLKVLKSEISEAFDLHLPKNKNKGLLIHRIESAQDTIARAFKHFTPLNKDRKGLVDAIQWYLNELQDSTGISMSIGTPATEISMGKKQTAAVSHIFQETIKTIVRLGRFKKIDISIQKDIHRIYLKLKVAASELKRSYEIKHFETAFQFLLPRVKEWDGSLDIQKEKQWLFVTSVYPLVQDQQSHEIRILFGCGQPILMDSIQQMLTRMPDLFISEKSETFLDLMEKLKQPDFDLVLIDSSILGIRATDRLKEIKAISHDLPVLVYHTIGEDDDFTVRLLRQGISGYLSQSSSTNELIAAIHRVAGGRKHISNRIAEKLAFEVDIHTPKPFHHKLSDRERQIMFMIAEGKTMKSIAAELCLSYTTIITYRNRVLEKMNMSSNTEIVRYVVAKGLI